MANIDKVQLEKIIDRYLQDEIPLSFLLEEYKLSFPQMKLLINRATSYTRKTDKLYADNPNLSYDNMPQEYIAIPHEIEEEYPFTNDQQIALFTKLESLKDAMPVVSKDMLKIIDDELIECQKDLEALNPEDIAKAEKIAGEIANMKQMDDDFEDIFRRNYITPQDFQRLDQVYTDYLREREKYSTLSAKRTEVVAELKTARRLTQEIEDIRADLTVHNIKLVNFCTRYFFSGIPLPQDEAQLYGVEGLVRAINGFDYKRGFQFSTYAVPTIVHTIERHFKEMTGYDWRDYCRKERIRYYRDEWRREIGDDSYEISARTLAESGLIALTEQEIANSDELLEPIVPLADAHEPYEDEEEFGKRKYPATFEDYSNLDTYADEHEIGVDDFEYKFIGRYINSTLIDVVMTLPVRNAQLIISRFGLDGTGYKTLEQVGKIFNVSRERARQIEAKGIRLLRHPSRSKQIKGLLDYFDETDQSISDLHSFGVPKK